MNKISRFELLAYLVIAVFILFGEALFNFFASIVLR
jgi:hypothetical protein